MTMEGSGVMPVYDLNRLVASLETVGITSFADLWSQFWSHSLIFSSEKGLLYAC